MSEVDSLESVLAKAPVSRKDGVLVYVPDDEDYCDNFGQQWNQFREMQIDSVSGDTESNDRFYAETGWKKSDLKGKVLLDAGCGAGRFTEIALEAGARVVAIDISEAIYACKKTISRFPPENYLLLKASLLDLPFKPGVFDGIYSLGVLQHTPDPLGGIRHLSQFLKPGGSLATWIYEDGGLYGLFKPVIPRVIIRQLGVPRLSNKSKLLMSRMLTTLFFPIGWILSWMGRFGERLSVFLPYATRHVRGRGNLRRQWEYSVMDTFDWYGPMYDQWQREPDVRRAMTESGLVDIRRTPARGMAIVARRPQAAEKLDPVGST
ncbi:MAG TPA: class I SAM-dependent methyltransferase [Pirellulales bacterium]|jgi:SAM-dependent methyltransferase